MGLTTGRVARQARVHLQAPRSAAARESIPGQGTVRALPAPQASPPPQPPAPSHPDARASSPMSTPAACGYGRECHDMALPAAVITDCSLENKCVGQQAQMATRHMAKCRHFIGGSVWIDACVTLGGMRHIVAVFQPRWRLPRAAFLWPLPHLVCMAAHSSGCGKGQCRRALLRGAGAVGWGDFDCG